MFYNSNNEFIVYIIMGFKTKTVLVKRNAYFLLHCQDKLILKPQCFQLKIKVRVYKILRMR